MKTIREKIMNGTRKALLIGGLATCLSCETPSPIERAMFGPGGIERLSAQGYYQMADDPSLTQGQREGALIMGNILDNQANYAQGAAIAREGRDQIVIVNEQGQTQSLMNSQQNQIPLYPGKDLDLQAYWTPTIVVVTWREERKDLIKGLNDLYHLSRERLKASIINNNEFFEGNKIREGTTVESIDAQGVILNCEGKLYRLLE